MSNNRDDNYESQDDSEYHFSDDDVSYEVESETKAAPATSVEQGTGGTSRLAGSKRMIISFGVFLAIVYVVYRFFSPSSSTPAVDISTAPQVASAPAPAPAPVAAPAPAPVAAAPAPAPVATAPAAAPAPVAQAPSPAPVAATAPVAQPVTPPVMAQQPPVQAGAAALPPVIPVQSTVPTGSQSPMAAMGQYVEEKSATLNAVSQQAMAQIQSQYTQQFNDFAAQNKSLQNQLQSLSARVVEMEAQINQMVQVLTRRNNSGSTMNNPPPPSPAQEARSPQVKIAYNVQAIIPGRAWLKSENGETLTVAEGDVIREVGRVTKIDPYDGVVEISTGTKSISLSYGNGG